MSQSLRRLGKRGQRSVGFVSTGGLTEGGDLPHLSGAPDEPLSLDCGHSFCQACITEKIKESVLHPGGERSCPVCQTRYQSGNLQLLASGQPSGEMAINATRGEVSGNTMGKLLIFCEEDGKVIYWPCALSLEHHGHQILFIEEMVMKYQVGPRMEGERAEWYLM